jgi:membrane-associated phospholipid phosphatase
MGLLQQVNQAFPYVFHPITVLGVGILVLIHHEWERQGEDRSTLYRRIGGFFGAGALALAPTVAYFLITGRDMVQATKGPGWTMDALVAVGLFVVAGATWYLWRRLDWGELVPGAMVALAAVNVPYAALSPFWDISGHVIIALMPTLYLTLVDRKFWPSLLVPVLMIPNRVALNAHTWVQSITAFLVGAAVVAGLYWWQTGGTLHPEPDSTAL